MSLLETVRNLLTPAVSYPMVRLFPGGPIGNDIGLNPSAQPGDGAVPEPNPQIAEPEIRKSKIESQESL